MLVSAYSIGFLVVLLNFSDGIIINCLNIYLKKGDFSINLSSINFAYFYFSRLLKHNYIKFSYIKLSISIDNYLL